MINLASASLEGATIEDEIEIYIKKIDLAKVRQHSLYSEGQRQFSFFVEKNDHNTVASGHRIRETITVHPNQEPVIAYEQCMKIRDPETGKTEEYNTTVDQEHFNAWKKVSDSLMAKVRYFIPFPDRPLIFQVDVFENSEWTKVDLEVQDYDGALSGKEVSAVLTALGLGGTDMIVVFPEDKANRTETARMAKTIMDKTGVEMGPFG